MIIQQYEMFLLHVDSDSSIDVRSISEPIDNIFYIKVLLAYSFSYIGRHDVLDFIEKMKTMYKDGISFEMVDISIDNNNDLVYFSESYHTYNSKPMTPEIEELLEEDNLIKLCKMGFLGYIVMTKENFIHLLLIWAKTLNQLSPFALLYKDESNWFDVLPFDSQEAMEKFVADHTKQEIIQK